MKIENKKNGIKEPKLRFPEFKDRWALSRLDNITKIFDGTHSTPNYKIEGVPFYSVRNVTANNFSDTKFIDRKVWEKENERVKLERNDILLTRIGDIGTSKLIDWDVQASFYVSLALIKSSKHFNSSFVNQYIQSFRFQHELWKRTIHVAFPRKINLREIGYCNISLPSWPEQDKIESFLTAVDQRIQQLSRKKKLLEQYKQSIMQKIFKQEIRFKDDSGNDYPDWEEKQLSEFLIPTFREVPKPSKPYLAIGIRSHCKGTFQKPDFDPRIIAMEKLFLVKEFDLIVNITFAWEGAIAMVKKEDDGGLVSHRFPTYTFDRSKVLNHFFKYIFIQKRFRYILELISPGGAGRNRVLSKKEFLKIKWTMPLIEEQEKITLLLIKIDEKIDNTAESLHQTQQFKKGLLQQMFV